jgi:Response regulator containing CheY-like receiver, AAA-type ATPase, and DNA-binding domains
LAEASAKVNIVLRDTLDAMARVLIVDDESEVRQAVRRTVEHMGHHVTEAVDGADAVKALDGSAFDLVVSDLRMPRADGFAVLRKAQEPSLRTPVVILTASTKVSDCVEAMRSGAFNFLVKPFRAEELKLVLETALARGRPGPKAAANRPAESDQPQAALVGDSAALRGVVETITQVAGTDATVLLLGESGTGKEVVARLIHAFSPRVGNAFVAVNCGAIPDGLVESELFGHAKGAFTGATDVRAGKFLEADGGTLFLDEISELALGLQVKLLRVLQDRIITPVGESKTRQVNTRVVAASNSDLQALVKEGKFRSDLFFRLNVVPITLPALRERAEDVPSLCQHFLASANRRTKRNVVLSEAALVALQLYDWPGNVRELENLVERLVILSRTDVVGVEDLPRNLRTPASDLAAKVTSESAAEGIDLPATLARIEVVLIERAMRAAHGNKTRAAELLGLSRTTLFDKLKRAGIEPGD